MTLRLARRGSTVALAVLAIACGSEQTQTEPTPTPPDPPPVPTDQPTRSLGVEIQAPDAEATVTNPFALSAEAQDAGYVVWRAMTASGETLIDWQIVNELTSSDPSGFSSFQTMVTLPEGTLGAIVVEVGMRGEPDGETEHVDRHPLTLVEPESTGTTE